MILFFHLPELLLTDFKSPLLDDKLVFEFGVDGVDGFISFEHIPLVLFSLFTELHERPSFDDWLPFCEANLSCLRNFARLFWNHTWKKIEKSYFRWLIHYSKLKRAIDKQYFVNKKCLYILRSLHAEQPILDIWQMLGR